MTVAGKVVAPTRLTLSGSVGFVNQSRRTAAKERPEPLCGLQKGYKQGLGQGAVRELSRRTYINRLKPRLDFYLITDNTVTIHLFTVKVGQSCGKVGDYIGEPFLVRLYCRSSQFSRPIGLLLYEKVACLRVGSQDGPSRPDLENLSNLV
jgi:hypothetical protein